jgi:hypothetical protein
MIKNLLRKEEANVMVIVAASMIVVLGMAAFAIDIGYIYTAKNQLQTAADASALAGASGLLYNQAEATNRAIQFAGLNTCINEPVVLSPANISFPTADRINVQANRQLDLFFGRVLGIHTITIDAVAEAEIGVLDGVGGLKPWAIPDLNYPLGAPVVLKAGELGAPGTSSGFFYPVDFPPINRGDPISGAQEYGDNIMYGADEPIFVGDELLVEPGNMIGPTAQGIQYLIDQDPNAYWFSDDEYGQNGGYVSDSDFEGFTSPRIVKIPFYDPNYPPDSGRNTVTVIRLGAFFVEGVSGRNVIGRFMEITSPGFGEGSSSLIKDVRLVK